MLAKGPDESVVDSCRRIARHVREAREKGRFETHMGGAHVTGMLVDHGKGRGRSCHMIPKDGA